MLERLDFPKLHFYYVYKICYNLTMKNVYIGTSGYSYKDWSEIFYPKKLNAADYLNYYSTQFNFSELNFSYYTQPVAGNIEKIVSKTPPGFQFAIKSHKSLTHAPDPFWTDSVKEFKDGIQPLIDREALSAILMQFPYSFHYTPGNRRYLAQICDQFQDYPICVEFRNTDWMQLSVYTELKKRNVPTVFTDMPKLKGLPDYFSLQDIPPITGDFLYFRFHGRNSENWWTGNNATRYDYLYSLGELDPWAKLLKKLIGQVKKTLVAFNNHLKGQAVKNAKEFEGEIKKEE